MAASIAIPRSRFQRALGCLATHRALVGGGWILSFQPTCGNPRSPVPSQTLLMARCSLRAALGIQTPSSQICPVKRSRRNGGRLATLESIRNHLLLWQSFLTISRTDAQRRNARPFRFRHSQSFARRRHRLSHAIVLSTIQRLGNTTNLPVSERLTICTLICSHARFRPCWNCGP
jgi:hypothetical protein